MTAAALAAHVQMVLAATPSPTPGFDQTTVTPGVAGFLITFGVAAVALLLALDMTRRIRRTRYREEIRAKLEAERDGRPAPGSGTGPDGTTGTAGGSGTR
ncbi:hypothetical protein [Planctomonas deserti]|uniref:hypothetical protein n=1 Tax=Planctomonas deserti TaxID=2144185 RepID=UPI000D378F34|nr:hypothetical protein [Planctomonas deserti]